MINMEKRRIWVVLFILTVAIGFTMTTISSVSAAKKTVKFKDSDHVIKNIGYGEKIVLFSAGEHGKFWNFDFTIRIENNNGRDNDPNKKHELIKAKVKLVKKEKVKYRDKGKIKTKWKNKYTTKTFKAKNNRGTYLGEKYFFSDITNPAPNRLDEGWKAYSAVVYYKKI